MATASLSPRFEISEDRLNGCTPLFARMLSLFSYRRCVAVNRRLGHLIVATQSLWLKRNVRVINFDRISHIVYRAQTLPKLVPWHYLRSDDSGSAGWSFFIIGLALHDEPAEVQLFTIWQAQPRPPDWLDSVAGTSDIDQGVGDESARQLVDTLRRLTGVSIVPKKKSR